MKTLRWAPILLLLSCLSVGSFAQTPPDGNIGTKGGGKSTAVTSLAAPLPFSSCAGAASGSDLAFDCALFGGAQAVFAGINETGYAWNSLAISLAGYNPSTDPSVNCSGGTIFLKCSVNPVGSTLTVDFSQDGGTGVSCDLLVNNCVGNSAAAAINDLNPKNPVLPYDWFNCTPTGSVCGADEFVVAVGYGGNIFVTPLSLSASLGADGALPPAITPEPNTFFLMGGALLAMLILGIKKGRLI